ncbi:MAG: FAD-dependent thymidylate synthase, partial [Candidatus Paceibacterota bacterium]
MNNDVKLISISKPLIEGINSSEELIAYISRVSNPTNQLNTETSEKLINYLIKHKHWSPFEQIFLTLEITTTRTIARQMLRHRSAFFQEFSQRYAEPLLKDFIISEVRFQDKKNRQNSIEITDKEKEDNQSLSVLENE